MKNLLSGLFYKWLAITFSYIIACNVLEYIFGTSASASFFDAGFIAFVILWCEQQDKIKKEGCIRNGTQTNTTLVSVGSESCER